VPIRYLSLDRIFLTSICRYLTSLKEIEFIRSNYKPIQPTVRFEDDRITYQEIEPSKEVSKFVYCFWDLKTSGTLDHSYSYRVVSDGCIDIFFTPESPDGNYIMGFCRKFTEFQIGDSFHYYGIRFLPSAFPSLFKVNAKVLSNTSQDLKFILPNFSEWISGLNLTSGRSIADILNSKLESIIRVQDFDFDLRFYDALFTIFERKGFLNVENDLNSGLSQRQLRRLFNFYIGTTPKAFSNVIRFQYILNAKPSRQSLKNDKIYYDVGFFDQAHFNKSFKNFYGVTPMQAFK